MSNTNKNLIINNVIFNNFKTLADGTLRLTIDLPEIDNDKVSKMVDLYRIRNVNLVLDGDEIEEVGYQLGKLAPGLSLETIEKINKLISEEKF